MIVFPPFLTIYVPIANVVTSHETFIGIIDSPAIVGLYRISPEALTTSHLPSFARGEARKCKQRQINVIVTVSKQNYRKKGLDNIF
jgi:hypothetical protein